MTVPPPLFKAKKDNSKDQIEKIYTQEEKFQEFQDNVCKAIAKIRKIYTDIV